MHDHKSPHERLMSDAAEAIAISHAVLRASLRGSGELWQQLHASRVVIESSVAALRRLGVRPRAS